MYELIIKTKILSKIKAEEIGKVIIKNVPEINSFQINKLKDAKGEKQE